MHRIFNVMENLQLILTLQEYAVPTGGLLLLSTNLAGNFLHHYRPLLNRKIIDKKKTKQKKLSSKHIEGSIQQQFPNEHCIRQLLEYNCNYLDSFLGICY